MKKTHLIVAIILLFCLSLPSFAKDPVKVKMVTNQGDIVLSLYPDKAPNTVKNFVEYAKTDFYDNTIYHRVIDGFMIQGGGYSDETTKKKTLSPIKNEADNGLKNDRGTIAMARTRDPHSATAQFFINLKNNDFLNHTRPTLNGWGYAVFGEVTEGMEVVDKIAKVKTKRAGMHQNMPVEAVLIKDMQVLE